MRKLIFACSCLFLVTPCLANPIPIPPPAMMPLEDMYVEITSVGDGLHAVFTGDFTFTHIPMEVLSMLFPVPPDADNIGVWQDGMEIPWNWSGDTYWTILPELPTIPMLGWFGPFPTSGAVFRVDYEHDLIKRPDEFIFFYASGTGKYFETYDKTTTAYFDILLPMGYIVKDVCLDYTPHEYEVVDGHLHITVQSQFGPIVNDLIVSLMRLQIYVATDGNDVTGDGSPENPFATIQKGIDTAIDGCTVVVKPGAYTGPGNRDIDFLGKAIALRSENGPETCIIDCQNASGHRGFYFHSGEDANSVVSGFTITNGYVYNNNGGGIYCIGSSPTIENCVIFNNNAKGAVGIDFGMDGEDGFGGGIFCTSDSNPSLIKCSIINNTAKGGNGFMGGGGGNAYGGGIYCSSIKLENCLIADNVALGGDGTGGIGGVGSGGDGYGAAIFCGPNGAVNVTNCTISNNDAAGGDGGDSTLPYAAGVGGNAYGGAIYSDQNSVSTIEKCIISENTTSGGDGGTIYPYPGMPIPPGEKGGDGYGGCAYYVANNQSTIENCTISDNAVLGGNGGGEGGPDGEGFAGVCYSIDSSTSIINSILWELTNGPDIVLESQYSQSLMNISCSDIQGGWDQVKLGNMCGILWGGNIDVDPCFADIGNSDYHLQSQIGRWNPGIESWVMDAATSLCIDAGRISADWTAELWPHGKRINMGAYGGTPQASMSLSDVGNIADLNNDDFVDYNDLRLYTEKWLNQEVLLKEDLDRNGFVDFIDFTIFAENCP